jgi:hypothetical protein
MALDEASRQVREELLQLLLVEYGLGVSSQMAVMSASWGISQLRKALAHEKKVIAKRQAQAQAEMCQKVVQKLQKARKERRDRLRKLAEERLGVQMTTK